MQGHVRQRKSKKWSYVFDLGYIDGKRKQKEVGGFDSKKEAQTAMRIAITEYEKGIIQSNKSLTYAEYLQYWLTNYVHINLKYLTIVKYEAEIKNHIIPGLGAYKINKLNHLVLQRFFTNKINAKYSRHYVNSIYSIINGSLNQALKWGFVTSNPMMLVTLPKNNKNNDVVVLTDNEIEIIYNRFKDTRHNIPFLIALNTGMRISEVCGLTWENINFDKKLIYITQTLQYQNKEWVLSTTKTKSSKRSVMMSTYLLETLRNHRDYQITNRTHYGIYYQESDFVCTGNNGKPVNCNTLKYFSRIINQELDINFKFHFLRHTFASNMLQLGIHPKIVQEILGHSNITTTLDTYSHISSNMQADAMNVFSEHISNVVPTEN